VVIRQVQSIFVVALKGRLQTSEALLGHRRDVPYSLFRARRYDEDANFGQPKDQALPESKCELGRISMLLRKFGFILGLAAMVGILVTAFAYADGPVSPTADTPAVSGPKASHRLIVELTSPPLAVWGATTPSVQSAGGRLNVQTAGAQAYIAQLQSEQATFAQAMGAVLSGGSVATYINEYGQSVQATYQVVFNGLAVEPGATDTAEAMRLLSRMPGVKGVYPDYAHELDMYASLPLINAQAAWSNSAIGGQANAGRGVKVASMDGGIHKDAPMFSGVGYSYPAGYPAGGLGLTANNNGKIIASRVYFRPWDPPSAGDENPWPGTQGTPHGNHTSSIAAGNPVVAGYLGITQTLSGVAPAAWVMSYRVFYNSVTNNGSFYNAEGIAALEDIARDGADVLNNSWGGGPGGIGGIYDPLDTALINAAKAGVFVSMSAGNAGPDKGTTDHPSNDYIDVAASSTSGTYASGRVSVTAPEPISATLQNMAYAQASFGGSLAPGSVYTYSFVASAVVSSTNVEGCAAWPAGTFTGKAALIRRGTCEFGVKALNAQNAGASFVVIYNNAGGGDTLINMSPGVVGNQVTIPAIFIWYSKGLGMVSWYTTNGAASVMTFDATAYQAGNTPDVIASFSSRGPGVGSVLKPDIAAPGVSAAPGLRPGFRHLHGGAARDRRGRPDPPNPPDLVQRLHQVGPHVYIQVHGYLDRFGQD
jgi:minor extracellular serine protease Vpr